MIGSRGLDDDQKTASPNTESARRQLKRISNSTEFLGATRLLQFLTYVVEESLAGRADGIRGKSIAQDVYDKLIEEGPGSETVVRVDAGRLRRRLENYYAVTGSKDPIKIEIPVRSYAPVFHETEASLAATVSPSIHKSLQFQVAVIGLLVVVGGVLFFKNLKPSSVEQKPVVVAPLTGDKTEAMRKAMFDKSPASLQAYDFAQQARELMFPPTNKVRLQSALDMFQQAIRMDPTYFGGYAGAAQVLGFQVYFSLVLDTEAALVRAKEMAAKAQELNPVDAWAQVSLGWVAQAAGLFEQAIVYANRAAAIDIQDRHTRDFIGVIYNLNGEFELTRQVIGPILDTNTVMRSGIDLNNMGAASFHVGDYPSSIEFFEKTTELGGVTSALTLSYLAASHRELGNMTKANELFDQLRRSWPTFDYEAFFTMLFRRPEDSGKIIDSLAQIDR